MRQELIFVTGFFGAPIERTARRLAEEKNYGFLSLDEAIEDADGRSVLRICMMMGEHEYRNKEYELLRQITGVDGGTDAVGRSAAVRGLVVCCSDGVLLDEMSRNLIRRHTLVIVGGDMTCDELWEQAKDFKNTCHAFLSFGSEEERKAAFQQLHTRQRQLFAEDL